MSMETDERMTFKAQNGKGEWVTCEVLFTFESEKRNKNYIVYTDNTLDEVGCIKVYASEYDPDVEESDLIPIESEEEWAEIEELLEEIKAEVLESAE